MIRYSKFQKLYLPYSVSQELLKNVFLQSKGRTWEKKIWDQETGGPTWEKTTPAGGEGRLQDLGCAAGPEVGPHRREWALRSGGIGGSGPRGRAAQAGAADSKMKLVKHLLYLNITWGDYTIYSELGIELGGKRSTLRNKAMISFKGNKSIILERNKKSWQTAWLSHEELSHSSVVQTEKFSILN